MPFYPTWVVLVEDTAKGIIPRPLHPREAQDIIDAIETLQLERDSLRVQLAEARAQMGRAA